MEPTAPGEPTPARKKFKHTQQLVKIALEELTQDEIARICRTSQSVVSNWKNGQSRATEQQIEELKRRYGHRLHRATFRVYHALREEPPPVHDRRAGPWERESDPPTPLQVVQVEGPVTLRHTLYRAAGVDRTGRPVREAAGRWVVHHLGRDRFALVLQRRRVHLGLERDHWEQASVTAPRVVPVEAHDDAARWISYVQAPLTVEALLAHADIAAWHFGDLVGVAVLPFLVRKMLLELAYPVDGVVRIGGDG